MSTHMSPIRPSLKLVTNMNKDNIINDGEIRSPDIRGAIVDINSPDFATPLPFRG